MERNDILFHAVFTLTNGNTVITESARLTVDESSLVVTHPKNVTVTKNGVAEFRANINISNAIVQWYHKNPNSPSPRSIFVPIIAPTATSKTLRISINDLGDTTNFLRPIPIKAIFTLPDGRTVETNPVTLTLVN